MSWTDNSGTRILKASFAHFYYRAGGQPPGGRTAPAGGIEGGSKHARQLEVLGVTAVSPSPPTRCSSGTLVVSIRFPDCVA